MRISPFPYLLAVAVCASIPEDSGAVDKEQPQFATLDFDVYRGNSRADLWTKRESLQPVFLSRTKRDGSVLMELQNTQTFYMASLKIGSEKEETGLLVDTGSSDMWVVSSEVSCYASSSGKRSEGSEILESRSNGLGFEVFARAKSDGCTEYGSFDSSRSTTFHSNSSVPGFEIQYADNTEALGTWGTDSVGIGSTVIPDLSFAVVNVSSSNVGVLGIGSASLESTFTSLLNDYQYENMPMKMKSSGLIHKNVYSLYLGNVLEPKGSILFGAIDHAKYSGTLSTVPIVNENTRSSSSGITKLKVVSSSINLSSASANLSVTTNSYPALLDSGSTLSYFPYYLFVKFGEVLGARYSSSYQAYLMPCASGQNDVKLSIDFSGQTIDVPLSSLLLPLDSTGDWCFVGVLEQTSSSYILFGDNVLQSMYVVFDLEELEVSIAKVKYSNDTNIEVITSTVPSAVKAPRYSQTSLSSGTEGSVSATLSLTSTAQVSSRGSFSTRSRSFGGGFNTEFSLVSGTATSLGSSRTRGVPSSSSRASTGRTTSTSASGGNSGGRRGTSTPRSWLGLSLTLVMTVVGAMAVVVT